MATIYVDGKAYEVEEGPNLLHACLELGFNLEYFCWHPAMGSVGACRQCAVKQYQDENDQQGRIVMSCMTPVTDGMRISIDDPEVVDFRAQVIELLMVNHPHDCPICDEGGECHLQDMTVMTGHAYRDFRFKKRTYRNQYLGPFINHEMNRCIQCYRCVRFYQEYAGGDDLDVFGAHDHVYFGRHEDGVLELEFSGNLVEVCPTGVFTDKTLKRHYTRKWDLQSAPSVCVHCGLGCNTIPGERYGTIRRVRNRYNREVNGYFICDRGRYGYEFVNSDQRILHPRLREQEGEASDVELSQKVLSRLGEALSGEGRAIGIGSPRASVESNFALRQLVGAEHFYAGVSERDHRLVGVALRILQEGPARSASLHDVEQCDAALVLGEDLTNTAPMLALALQQLVIKEPIQAATKIGIPEWQDHAVREVVQEDKGPLFVATPTHTKLDKIATRTHREAPENLARLGFAIAHELDPQSPDVPGLSEQERSLAVEIAEKLKAARRPVVISGTSCGSESLLQAAANIAWALGKEQGPADLCLTVPENNSLGLAMMGAEGLESARQALEGGGIDTLVVLENDLYRRAQPEEVDALVEAVSNVVFIDHLESPTSAHADVILPAATFAEGDGTLVNNEGRLQRYFQVFEPEAYEAKESWRWLGDMMVASGRSQDAPWENWAAIAEAVAQELPVFAPIQEVEPPPSFRVAGAKIPREPHRYTGRTAMRAHINVSEPQPPQDPDSPYSFSMEGYKGKLPGAYEPRYWSPGWNSVQALNKFQSEIGGPLEGGDPGKRLIEPESGGAQRDYFRNVPPAFEPRDGEWLLLPLYHIFGSEELSALTPGVAELAPEPYLALNPGEAEALSVAEGDALKLEIAGVSYELPARLVESMPTGALGFPYGLDGMPFIPAASWGKISPVGG